MKLNLNPMVAIVTKAEQNIDRHFNSMAQAHLDQVYKIKREDAQEVVASGGMNIPEWMIWEANLKDITPTELAYSILSKKDQVIEREILRQDLKATLRNCKTPDEVTELLTSHNISDI